MKEYDGFLVDDDLTIYSARTGRKLSPYKGTDGYMHVQYRIGNRKSHHNRVHVIYAHCFIPNPDNLGYVNHKDTNKMNNNLSNLEWTTNAENVKHGWDNGCRVHKNNTHVYVSDSDGNYIGDYTSIRKCAEALKLDRHKIARILKGELAADYLGYLFSYFAPTET